MVQLTVANFLQHLASIDLGTRPNLVELAQASDPQASYDTFYSLALGMLEKFYPERTITVTSRDPQYITAGIKAVSYTHLTLPTIYSV